MGRVGTGGGGEGGAGEAYPFFFLGEGLLESESLLGGITLVGSSLLLPDLLQNSKISIYTSLQIYKKIILLSPVPERYRYRVTISELVQDFDRYSQSVHFYDFIDTLFEVLWIRIRTHPL
jgi:hypothetical protein